MNSRKLIFPVISQSAEYLVMGQLMRRNVMVYKAPQGNQGYDLLCVHSVPALATKCVRIQVKSRYQTDCDRSVPVREDSFEAFDFLAVVFLNVGVFDRRRSGKNAELCVFDTEPEMFFLPSQVARGFLRKVRSGFSKVHLPRTGMEMYRGAEGIKQVAGEIGVEVPWHLPIESSPRSAF